MQPYAELARLDKPIGTALLLWPCIWGVSLAAPLGQLPDPYLCVSFSLGAFIMRGAGCTINDLWDQDFDRHVERTRLRPLARGAVSSRQALVFLAGQLSCGLAVLLLSSFHPHCVPLALASMPLVVAYPLMKRYSGYPQLVLGLAFNWGALVGWCAVLGADPLLLSPAMPLYCAGVAWTLIYDTLYGYQDRADDARLGLRSTAITFGDRPQWILSGLAAAMVSALGATGLAVGLTAPYYAGVAGVAAHLLWQIWTADIRDPSNLSMRFQSNAQVGAIVALAIVAGHF